MSSTPLATPDGSPSLAERILFGLALAALLAFTALTTLREVVQVDPWFHLSAGRWILAHGLPERNVFLEFERDHAFVDHEWLYQLGAILLYKLGGLPLLSLAKAAAVALAVACVAALPSRKGASSLILVGLFGFASYPRFILRPEVISLAALALTLLVCLRLRRRSGRFVAGLAALQWLWVGCHGLFILGPAVVGCLLAESLLPRRLAAVLRLRPGLRDPVFWGAALGAQLGVCLLGPYGLDGALFPFVKLASSGVERGRIIELESPFANLGTLALDTSALLLALALALASAALLLARRRLRLSHALIALGLGFAGSQTSRTAPFAALGALPLIAAALDELARMLRPGALTLARRGALAGLIALAGLGGAASFEGQLHRSGLFEARLGLGAAQTFRYGRALAFWEQSPPAGPYFNAFGSGHSLLWDRPEAQVRPFICGNTDLYSQAFFDDYWRAVTGRVPFAETAERYGITELFLDHRLAPGLVQALAQDSRWRAAYLDDQVVIFRRSARVPEDAAATYARALLRGELEDLAADRYAALHAAYALSLWPGAETRRAAVTLARELHEAHPSWTAALFVRARAEQDAGFRQRAAELYEQLAEARPGDVRLEVACANAWLIAGEAEKAIARFELARALGGLEEAVDRGMSQALLTSGRLVELRRLLATTAMAPEWARYFQARAASREGDLARAEACYREAIDARESFVEARFYLAELLFRSGRKAEAAPEFARLLELAPRDADAWEYLGAARFEAAEYGEAARCWRNSWDISPGRPQVAVNLADALGRSGRYDEAIDWARRARSDLEAAKEKAGEALSAAAAKALDKLAGRARKIEVDARAQRASSSEE